MILQNLDYNPIDPLDRTEAQRVIEQLDLDTSKTSLERNRLGQFATPNALAIEMLQYTKTLLPPEDEIHFLDPAIGTGSFYSALLQSFPAEQIKRACGYEIDRTCAEVTHKLWANTSLQLHIQDFTQSLPPLEEQSRFNLLICNPPYVRHHHLSRDQKTFLKQLGVQETGIELSGLAGLYCYFLLAAHRWMRQHGYACWLIPSEFMDVNYGGKIKEYLLEHVTLLRVHRFTPEDLQFAGVLVSSSVVWIKNTKPTRDYSIEFTDGGTISTPQSSRMISSSMLKTLSKWNKTSIFSTPPTRGTGSDLKLSDLFEIKRGVATGANDFFILTPETIEQYRIPSEFLTPILPSPRHLSTNEVLSDRQGNPNLIHKLFLLTCKQPMEALEAYYPSVKAYLQTGEAAGISERYLCRHRSLWYLQETRHPAMFLCPYMGRQQSRNGKPFRFILNHSKAIAPNVYLMMYPKGTLKTLIGSNPEVIPSIWKALNSISIQSLMHEGRVYGDGLHKLEPRELANASAEVLLELLEAI